MAFSPPAAASRFSVWGRRRAESIDSQDSHNSGAWPDAARSRQPPPATNPAAEGVCAAPNTPKNDAPLSSKILSSSFASAGHREPLRSFINAAHRDHLSHVSSQQYARSVREDTAELATYTLNGDGSPRHSIDRSERCSSLSAVARHRSLSFRTTFSADVDHPDDEDAARPSATGAAATAANPSTTEPIEETSEPEPSPPAQEGAGSHGQLGDATHDDVDAGVDAEDEDNDGPSLLTRALRRSPPHSPNDKASVLRPTGPSDDGTRDDNDSTAASSDGEGESFVAPANRRSILQSRFQTVERRRSSTPRPSESTPLLPRTPSATPAYTTGPAYDVAPERPHGFARYGYDIEGQKNIVQRHVLHLGNSATEAIQTRAVAMARSVARLKHVSSQEIWKNAVVAPVACLPAVIVGLLLNILDALSYGMILFPLGNPIFAHLGSAGISIFYVSTIMSQLVFSSGSIFRGGIGSELIEVVPFFHRMAATITGIVGEDDPEAVIATTITAYALSAMVTGSVFYLMGHFQFGYIVGFIPRHILIGCIGGVGWFLVQTGFEVTARLDDSLNYDLSTLHKLIRPDTLPLWIIPFSLATILFWSQKRITNKYFLPLYIIAIPFLFYFFTLTTGSLHPSHLRRHGWVFAGPPADEPWWFFYTLFKFQKVHWGAIGECVPAMFALTFFGILHVPINVPALALNIGEDHADLDHELKLHGFSNFLSGCVGSIQNYLVYANTVFFMRSGGNSRLAGFELAALTFCVMLVGPKIVGFIPVMMVGCLIFDLGFELLVEAIWQPRKKLKWPEYITVIVIVLIMGIYDFVVGIGVGILLAFVALIFQTSQVSAVRATYYGDMVTSTVRRNHSQHHYLRQVGRQICTIKLAGYLFFGTIVSVERTIRELIAEEAFIQRPIRYLIIDLHQVTGLDYSAGEAFNTISRLLDSKRIHLVLSGVDTDRSLGHDLRAVGLGEDGIEVVFLPDINSALELCENELLKTLYASQVAEANDLSKLSAPPATAKATPGRGLHEPSDSDDEEDALDDESIDYEGTSFEGFQNADVVTSKGEYLPPPPRTVLASLDLLGSTPRQTHLQAAAKASLDGPGQRQRQQQARWQNFSEPLRLMLQVFDNLTTQNEDFWFRASSYFVRREFRAGQLLFRAGALADGFYLLETGIVRAEYDVAHGQGYHENIVAGTTCGELPFFSETPRTATVYADLDCVVWVLERAAWQRLQRDDPIVATELLRVSLKLTAERMATVPSLTILMAD